MRKQEDTDQIHFTTKIAKLEQSMEFIKDHIKDIKEELHDQNAAIKKQLDILTELSKSLEIKKANKDELHDIEILIKELDKKHSARNRELEYKHGERIMELENFRWKLGGGLLVVTAVLQFIISKL